MGPKSQYTENIYDDLGRKERVDEQEVAGYRGRDHVGAVRKQYPS